MSEDLGRSVLRLVTDRSGLTSGLAVARTEALNSIRGIQQGLAAAGTSMSNAGRQMTVGITAPILAAGTAIFNAGKDFEQTLNRIVGLTDVTRGELEGIKTDILGISKETGRGPQELAEAFYFVASAGFTAGEAMDVLRTAAMASAAGLGRTQDVAKVLGLTINAYGKENITAARAADILVAAVKDGTAEADAFAGVLGRVVPTAATLGVTFDQVTAALAGMTLTGLSADEAATSLNQVLVSLLKPTREAEAQLSELGLSAGGLREELKEKGLLSVLRHLEEAFQGNDEAAGLVFGNVRALRGVLSLLSLDADQLNDVFKDTAAAQGDLADGYSETEGTARDYERVQADIQATLIELSKDVMPVVLDVLRTLAGLLGDMAGWFASLPPDVRNVVVEVAALAALAGPVLVFAGAVTTAAGALSKLVLAAGPAIPLLAYLNYEVDKYNKIQANPDGAFAQVREDAQWALDHPLIPTWFRGIAEGLGLVDKASPGAAGGVDLVVHALTDTEWAARDAIESHRILVASLPPVVDAYKKTAAEGPEAYAKRQKEALDKAIADQATYTAEALQTLQDFRTALEGAFKDAQDAALDFERTKVAIATKQAELVALDAEYTKDHGKWTRLQGAQWRLRKDEALAELNSLKLHAALIGDDIQKTSALKSLLASKDMKDGLTSKFPETKAAYEALKAAAIAELNRIGSQGGPAAKEAAKVVAKYLDPDNPSSPLYGTHGWGSAAGKEYVQGIADGLNKNRVIKLSLEKVAAMLAASSPPGPASPLHEIDKWGQRTGSAWLDPLVGVLATAPSALRIPLDAAARVLTMPMGSAGLQLAAAAAGVGLGGFSRNVPTPAAGPSGMHGPLIGELHIDARGHPDAAGVYGAVKQAIGDGMADVFRDQSRRGITGVKP